MNKIFKIFFNKVLHMFTVTSELANAKGKKSVKVIATAGVLGLSIAAFSGEAMAAPTTFWKKYQAPNDTALTTTANTYITGSNSKTGATSVTIQQRNAAGVRTVSAGVSSASAYLPGTTNANVVLYEKEAGTNTFVGTLKTLSNVYTITSTYDKSEEKWTSTILDQNGNPPSGINLKVMSVTELTDVEYESGKISKVTTGSAEEQGYFQTNTITTTKQVSGKQTTVTNTTRIGDVITANTSADGKTLTVSVNGVKASLTDKDTTNNKLEVSGDAEKTITLTDSAGNKVEGTFKDKDTTYTVETTTGTGNVVNNYEIKDNTGKSVAKLQDTDTTYLAEQKTANNETTVTLTEAKTGKQVGQSSIKGSDNIKVEKASSGNGAVLKLADDIKVNSVEAKTVKADKVEATTVNAQSVKADTVEAKREVKVGNTSIKKDGIRVGKSMVFTQNNVNMGNQQVHGVAAGTAPTDAVNVSQLQATEAQINQRFANVDKHVDRVEDNAYAGVAMALATAGLPQAWQPGKSMIAIAAGTYMGEQGYALGFSHNTENGKWTLKATASGNSQGHFGGSVGAGYMW